MAAPAALPPLVLASASPRRRDLLAALGHPFAVAVSGHPEADPPGCPPHHLPLVHAEAKAAAVAARHPAALVLGADTVVILDGEVLGKPAAAAAARTMLLRLAGREHEVVTGVCLLAPARHLRCRFAATTRVRFRPFGPATADAYLARINPLDKAGAYALQEDDGALGAQLDGSWSNVVGLPLEQLALALRACRTAVAAAPARTRRP